MENILKKYNLEFLSGVSRILSFVNYDGGACNYYLSLVYLSRIVSYREAFETFIKLGAIPAEVPFSLKNLDRDFSLEITPDEKGGCVLRCKTGADSLAEFIYSDGQSAVFNQRILSGIRNLFTGWEWRVNNSEKQKFIASYFLNDTAELYLKSPGKVDGTKKFFSSIETVNVSLGSENLVFPLRINGVLVKARGLFVGFEEVKDDE